MKSEKIVFTETMKRWLEDYLNKNYSKEYDIRVLEPSSNLSKIAIESIKKINNYSSFEFYPDILGIMNHKKIKNTELVFMNRSISAISLKELGELCCYSRLANPILSFIVSPKGLSDKANFLLLNKDIEKKLLNYQEGRSIIVFRWNDKAKEIDKNSIFPISKKGMLYYGFRVLENKI